MPPQGLPEDFVELLRAERRLILPCLGAGMSTEAGVGDLTVSLIEAGKERDIELQGNLAEVCMGLENAVGLAATRALVAGVMRALPVTSTGINRALAQAPSRTVATFNYDDSVEQSAREVNLTPRTILPTSARAYELPAKGEVNIIHLHGSADEPDSIILPGQTTAALAENEVFLTLLRSLWARHRVLYFGFRFGVEEVHLRETLGWMRDGLGDARPQQLLLSRRSARSRAGDLDTLTADGMVEVVTYEERPAVRQAALILAPANDPAAERLEARADPPKPYYVAPRLLPSPAGEDDSELRTDAFAAEMGLGAEWVTINELIAAQRALIVAVPGMGKTQLLRRAGELVSTSQRPVFVQLKGILAELNGGEPGAAFARFLANAQAFDADTPRPTVERLEDGSYLFLLDGFDEVPPDRRGEVMEVMEAALSRWPQHGYLVTTRPSAQAADLLRHGFFAFRIVLSASWGLAYLEHRGIAEEKVQTALETNRAISDLIGIPMYAAAIGERLGSGAELPARPLNLLIDTVTGLAREEAARRVGTSEEAYCSWLYKVAIALELRGLSEVGVEDLTGLPGPEAGIAGTRTVLIEAALLRDAPNRVAFPEKTIQEALCADAFLRSEDVATAVEDFAVADIDGERVIRGDIDATLDLVFSNAEPEDRRRLRTLDELRWAVSLPTGATAEEAGEAIDCFWSWYSERRIFIDSGRELPARIAAEHRAVLAAKREELIAATASPEITIRANAMELLAELGPDEDAEAWLLPRLEDENQVVRRHAANTAARFGLRAAFSVIKRLFPSASGDEDDAFARALIELSLSPEELDEVAALIATRPRTWRGVADRLAKELSLPAALALVGAELGEREAAFSLLSKIVARHPASDWSADDVESLTTVVVGAELQAAELGRLELEPILSRHPEAALRGVRTGAERFGGIVLWPDLLFLSGLDRDLLREEANGPLGEAFSGLIASLEAGDQAAEPEVRSVAEPVATTAAETLGSLLNKGRLDAETVPADISKSDVEELSEEEREILGGLIEEWWPAQPLDEVLEGDANGYVIPNGLQAALAGGAGLDLPLTESRWLEILANPIAIARPGVAAWLNRQFSPSYCMPAAQVITEISDDWHLYYALVACPELPDPVARAFADKAPLIGEVARFGELLRGLVEAGRGDLLATIALAEIGDEQRRRLREMQAAAGNVDAQLEMVAHYREQLEAGDPAGPMDWGAAVSDERVIAELGELLGLLGPSGMGPNDLQRTVVRTLASTRSTAALRAYDRLLEDGSFDSAFFWYPRQELARQLATDAVLSRLPGDLAEVAELLWAPEI